MRHDAALVVELVAAGVVGVKGAIALGVIAALGCYFVITLKGKLGYDDTLDAFGVHGAGGIIGAIALTFFIRDSWARPEGWTLAGQLVTQLKAVGATIVFAGGMTALIGFLVHKTIGLRLTEASERSGLDHELHGERGYGLTNLN